MSREATVDLYRRHVNRGMARIAQLTHAPLEVTSRGSLVMDQEGTEYLDAGGYSVFLLGHRHPKVVEAVKAQLDRHPLATRLLLSHPLALASERLAQAAPGDLDFVLFTSAGSEAVEAALKLARLNGFRRVITFEGGYHGKSLGALSVSGRDRYRLPFLPLLPSVVTVPWDDVQALTEAVDASPDRPAVIFEPIQSEAGVRLPSGPFLSAVDALRGEGRCLLIVDEISTGLGRTGVRWQSAAHGVQADVLVCGKALGGGVMPVSALVTSGGVFDGLNRDPVLHSSTFAGNPMACAAVTATLDVIEEEHVVQRAEDLGVQLREALEPEVKRHSSDAFPLQWRSAGLLAGIEFPEEHLAADMMMELLDRRVISSHSLNGQRTLRLTPPVTLNASEMAWLVEAVTASLRCVMGRQGEQKKRH